MSGHIPLARRTSAWSTNLEPKDSIKPLNPIATAVDSDVTEELDEAVGTSSAGSSATSESLTVSQPHIPSPGPSTSADPQPGCSRPKTERKDEVLEYLKEYGQRQEKRQRELDAREEERERKKEPQMDMLIGIFGKLLEKNK